jgi:oligoribonuclease NrnB/cAMP/cGMP phosphodiesterase (DHH superfamily)
MLFVDFSPPAERVQEFVQAGANVLDHHKTAKPIVEAFGPHGVFGDEVTEPGVCGAVLAFRHVWFQLKGPGFLSCWGAAEDFATLAGIRDTWQNKHPRWREAIIQSEMLFFYPIEHLLNIEQPFCRQAEGVWKERRQIATLLVEKHEVAVKNVLSKAWRFTTSKGTRVVCFEGTGLSSDATEALGSEADLVIGFGFIVENGEQKMICSCRSHTGYDVSAFAKANGGGGHSAAAGFNTALHPGAAQPYKLVELLIAGYEHQQTQG